MRFRGFVKLEIIRTVEDSRVGIRRTLMQIGIARSTFYNWYERYLSDGVEALEDQKPGSQAVLTSSIDINSIASKTDEW